MTVQGLISCRRGRIILNPSSRSIFWKNGSIGSEYGVAYGYLPFCLTSYNGIGVIEGVGISPDIEVRYDDNLYQTTGQDNQLDAALEAIRNGR